MRVFYFHIIFSFPKMYEGLISLKGRSNDDALKIANIF